MKHAPPIDVPVVFHVKDEMRMALQRPKPQPGQVQFVGITQRAAGRMAAEVDECPLEGVHKTERGGFPAGRKVMGDRVVDVLARSLAQDDGLCPHPARRRRMPARRLSK